MTFFYMGQSPGQSLFFFWKVGLAMDKALGAFHNVCSCLTLARTIFVEYSQ
jgi:hypothetical protein